MSFVDVGVHRVLRRRRGASLLLYQSGMMGLYSPLGPNIVPPTRLRRTEMTPPPLCP